MKENAKRADVSFWGVIAIGALFLLASAVIGTGIVFVLHLWKCGG